MFYVISKDLPTIATFIKRSRAYAFRDLLMVKGYRATVLKIEKEL